MAEGDISQKVRLKNIEEIKKRKKKKKFIKGTIMQTEKTLINDGLRVSKVS